MLGKKGREDRSIFRCNTINIRKRKAKKRSDVQHIVEGRKNERKKKRKEMIRCQIFLVRTKIDRYNYVRT